MLLDRKSNAAATKQKIHQLLKCADAIDVTKATVINTSIVLEDWLAAKLKDTL